MRTLAGILLLVGSPRPPADEAAELLSGVSAVAAPGTPGTLSVFGDGAFVVVAGRSRDQIRVPVIGATRWGSGRIVAFGHTGYFEAAALGTADTGRFIANAIRWAGRGSAPRVGVLRSEGLLRYLQGIGIDAAALPAREWWRRLEKYQVVCLPGNSPGAEEAREALGRFVLEGGGLLWTECGWGWLQLNPGKTLAEDHPGNRLMAAAGMVWSEGTAGPTGAEGIRAEAPALVHAGRALEWILRTPARPDPKESAQAEATLLEAAQAVPSGDRLFLPRLREFRRAGGDVPAPGKPLRGLRERVVLALEVRELERQPVESVRAHPAAGAFPGAVPEGALRVSRTVRVETGIPGWHGTGLYAAPGDRVTVRMAESACRLGLKVRIGCHTDRLWHHEVWSRVPAISRAWPLEKTSTVVASPFGGLLYVEVPAGKGAGVLEATFEGGVESPWYVLGRTSASEWREARARPGPWAELETSGVVVTVPSDRIRGLEDPKALMEFWDRVLDACADLAARPRARERPERIVADVQISAGYMHSGYPVMTHLDAVPDMVDLERLKKGPWGLFHELGHNHQSGDWTFEGAGEVTVNLFTRYVQDSVCGIPREKWRHTGEPAMRALRAHLAAGAPFDRWKADPFLALTMYDQLQEAFGWEAFKKVFAEYRSLRAEERPRSDADKRDQWMIRFSRMVGRNLGPFFQAWGVPTSEAARASVASLPVWMPKDLADSRRTP